MSDIDPNAQETTTPGSQFPPGYSGNPGINEWIQQHLGAAGPSYNPETNSPPTNGAGEVIPQGDPFASGSNTSTSTATPSTQGISPDDFVLDPATGELYGFKRTIEVDQATGKTIYGYQTLDLGNSSNLAAISTSTGIPMGVLSTKIAALQVQNAQVKSEGYGKLIGVNPDGSYTYQDASGTRQTTANPLDLAKVGISVGEINQAIAQSGQTQRTMTQMGQYTVAGMNPDGSLQVRDYNGNLSNVTAQQAAAGQIPGVSYADFQRAQADFATNQRTITQSGQFTLDSAQYDANGNLVYNVKNFNGQITPVYGPQLQAAVAAGQVPGVSASDLEQAQYKAQDMAWQLSPVNTPSTPGVPYFGNGYGNAPTQPNPTQPTPTQPTPTPNPSPTPSPNPTPSPSPTYAATPATPGASPTPTPTYPTTPATPGASPNPSPSPTPNPSPNPSPTPGGAAGGGTTAYAQTSTQPSYSSGQQAAYSAYAQTSAAPGKGGTAAPDDGSQGPRTMMGGGIYSTTMTGATSPASSYAATPSTPGGAPGGSVMTHQQQGEQNQAYQQNLSQTTATNAGMSRNMSGMGWSGIQPPRVAGYG